MTEMITPETGKETRKIRGRGDRIEIANAITSHERNPCLKISDRKTKWIKGNKNIIINNKLSHKIKISIICGVCKTWLRFKGLCLRDVGRVV